MKSTMGSYSISLANEIRELEKLQAWIEDCLSGHPHTAKLTFELNLVLEELFTNIVFYAFPEHGPQSIEIEMEITESSVQLRIEDGGIPFDPTTKPVPGDLDKPIEEREIGGLGIYLVRTLMDRVDYRRAGNRNVLHLFKSLAVE